MDANWGGGETAHLSQNITHYLLKSGNSAALGHLLMVVAVFFRLYLFILLSRELLSGTVGINKKIILLRMCRSFPVVRNISTSAHDELRQCAPLFWEDDDEAELHYC